MPTLDVPGLADGPLRAEATLRGGTLSLTLTGNADMRVMSQLHLLLTRIHHEAQRLGLKEVAVDVRGLEFMNSSCFKNFVTWINEVRESVADTQYRIRFLSNPDLLWQRRSLHALCAFAKELITVETPVG